MQSSATIRHPGKRSVAITGTTPLNAAMPVAVAPSAPGDGYHAGCGSSRGGEREGVESHARLCCQIWYCWLPRRWCTVFIKIWHTTVEPP